MQLGHQVETTLYVFLNAIKQHKTFVTSEPCQCVHQCFTSEAEVSEEVLCLGLASGQILDGGQGGGEGREGGGGGGHGGQAHADDAWVSHFDGRGAGRVGLRLGKLPLGLEPRSEMVKTTREGGSSLICVT